MHKKTTQGFGCASDHAEKHPGERRYRCEFCGTYEASRPICSKCEEI